MTRVLIFKELRAQALLFVLALAALAFAASISRPGSDALIMVVYITAVAVLGAHAIGHEYTGRTLTTALMQPISRARTYSIKMSVLAALLLLMVAATAFAGRAFMSTLAVGPITAIGLPLLAAWSITPLMSMVARSTFGGLFLTYFVSGTLFTALLLLDVVNGTRDRGVIIVRFYPAVLTAISIISIGMSRRQFLRLEAFDAQPAAIRARRFGAGSSTRTRREWRALLSKEIHVLQVPIYMTLWFAVMWVAAVIAIKIVPGWSSFPIGAAGLAFTNAFAAIVGSIAISEERRAGTQALQLVQPVAVWRQWLIKVAVTFAISVICGFVVPMAMAVIIQNFVVSPDLASRMLLLSLFITATTLYLGSISPWPTGGFVLALPVAFAIGFVLNIVADLVRSGVAAPARTILPGWSLFFTSPLPGVIVGAFVLWLGFLNYSSPEQSWRRSVAQIAAIAAVASVAMVLIV
jgi:ABC-type transport system involved in multi-copper enzyme maturation permease subunit